MFFEDIFNKVNGLWKDSFILSKIDDTGTYVQSILLNYEEIVHEIDFLHKKNYTEFERMLAFTMYQALTAHGIKKWKNEKSEVMNFNEITLETFEYYFRKNIELKGNEEYLKDYEGFRSSLTE
jgi:hypothetical protein